MPRPSQPPVGDRLLGRSPGARWECPRCGYLDHFKPAGGKVPAAAPPRLLRGRSARGWNPGTSRWKCPSCELVVVLGLLAWPIKSGSTRATLPLDQVPNYRQLAQLRAQGGGLWMRHSPQQYRATGSNICAGCTCEPGCAYTNQRDKACPLHGDQVGEG